MSMSYGDSSACLSAIGSGHALLEPLCPSYSTRTMRRAFIVWLHTGQQNDFQQVCNYYHRLELLMETDSPIRKPSAQPISKKLFHSPMAESPNEPTFTWNADRTRKAKKRKQTLIPDNAERIKRAYVKECDKDGYSPDTRGGMRKKVLISLFHNKEYSMDFGS